MTKRRIPVGRAPKPILDKHGNVLFESQKAASRALNQPTSSIIRHLNRYGNLDMLGVGCGVRVEYRGKVYKSIADLCRRHKCSPSAIRRHLDEYGNLDNFVKGKGKGRILATDPGVPGYKFLSMTDMAKKLCQPEPTLRWRLRRNHLRYKVVSDIIKYEQREELDVGKDWQMRMWMVDPKTMCRKHLLGEHVEIHMFIGAMKKGTSMTGFLMSNLLEPAALSTRHDALVREMRARKYRHSSPVYPADYNKAMAALTEYGQKVTIDEPIARGDLHQRCPECLALWEQASRKLLA